MAEIRPRILVVDEDPIVAKAMGDFLCDIGYSTAVAHSGVNALEEIEKSHLSIDSKPPQSFSVLIADMSMHGMSGLELIKVVRKDHSDIVPLAITGYGTIQAAVQAIRAGAIDYLTKPLVDEELQIAVEKAVQQQVLLAENTNLRQQLEQRYGLDSIIGSDVRMRRIYEVIDAVAASKTTVVMCGESGTGKSLIAGAIHRASPRADKPYVEISCGSIPETLLESELFGHVKGAFTGAHADKVGRFLSAHTGTIFLDEINSASPGMQLKLLRVLQERQFEPVGSNDTIEVDVRVILASNQPLEDLVASGEFRQDLYYRINVVSIELPPLRDRIGDIPLLAEHFLQETAREAKKQITGFTNEALDALRRYSYPGNVRELQNIIERAVVLTRATRIDMDDLAQQVIDNSTGKLLPAHLQGSANPEVNWSSDNPLPLRKALEDPEKRIILAALQANDWNRQKTADQLEVNRTTLYKKIKQYDLEEYGRTA